MEPRHSGHVIIVPSKSSFNQKIIYHNLLTTYLQNAAAVETMEDIAETAQEHGTDYGYCKYIQITIKITQ